MKIREIVILTSLLNLAIYLGIQIGLERRRQLYEAAHSDEYCASLRFMYTNKCGAIYDEHGNLRR